MLVSSADGAPETVANARNRRRRERIAEHARDELVRLAHELFPLAHEPGALEQQRATGAGGPLENAVKSWRRQWDVAYAGGKLGRTRLELTALGVPRGAFALELLTRFARLLGPARCCRQPRARLLALPLGRDSFVVLARRSKPQLGFAHHRLGITDRPRGGLLVGLAGDPHARQLSEEHRRHVGARPQLLDVALQLFHAGQRVRDGGIPALELFSKRQKRFQRRGGRSP